MGKLTRLQDRLRELGIDAALHEDFAAPVVLPPEPAMPVWVFVGYGGAYHSWQHAQKRHPVSDVAGAAQALAGYIGR